MLGINDTLLNIKGIGPKKFDKFSNLNISSIKDLLYYFPRNYEDRSDVRKINQLSHNVKSTIVGKICGAPREIYAKNKLRILKIPVCDDSGQCNIIFYNSPFLKNNFVRNKSYYFYGQASKVNNETQMIHPEHTTNEDKNFFTRITPIYGLTKGITQNDILSLQYKLLFDESFNIEDYLPLEIVKNNKLCDINYALRNIHFPSSLKALKAAKFRLIFEELFFFQLGLLIVKSKTLDSKGLILSMPKKFYDIFNHIPFKLTNAQTYAFDEIFSDMSSGKVMNRLIQGDVGSGKTLVALLSMYLTSLNNYQSALMAPTELLAEQHFQTFKKLLKPFNINTVLLTGSTKNKKEILSQIKHGQADIIIGTHALIQEKVEFNSLGLVVTDEQHRFGVHQRNFLTQKGKTPHILVMTATPIPRTLSLILYGDLDISTIDQLPPGRKNIKTYIVKENNLSKMYNFIKKEVENKRQAYIVCPLIEESEKIDSISAIELYKELKETYFNLQSVGIIHGKMNSTEKEKIMNNFEKGSVQILISTTVIEVGINVPNASIMVIQNAERFGLSQLHQLRGRVGRGENQSYCFLVSKAKNDTSNKRLKVMVETNDGFVISEKDLELRGPGDFFGTKQHGLPEMKIANLFQHTKILKRAQEEALNVIKNKNRYLKDQKLLKKVTEYFEIPLDNLTL